MSAGEVKVAKKRRVLDPLAKAMRERGWSHKVPYSGLRHRLYALAIERHRWYDWGHRVMILVGTNEGGNWSEPSPPTWWYHREHGKPMWRTHYPRSTFRVITDYSEFRAATDGLNEDGLYEWCAMGFDQDEQLILGHRYWGGAFYGLPNDETRLLRRYLRMARRHDWWGARSWLYSQALHAAVHVRVPRSCAATPPKGSGGYDHWHCTEKRGHAGLHRYRNYVWGEVGGEALGVVHAPEGSLR